MKKNITHLSVRLISLTAMLLIGSMLTCIAQQKRITMDLNYDKTNQLTSESMEEYYSTDFTYDFAGNRTLKSTISYIFSNGIFVPNINEKVSIYPNPVESYISVEFELQTPTTIKYSILNIDGRLLYTESKTEDMGKTLHCIDVFKYPSGTYILKISAKDEIQSALKFIIER